MKSLAFTLPSPFASRYVHRRSLTEVDSCFLHDISNPFNAFSAACVNAQHLCRRSYVRHGNVTCTEGFLLQRGPRRDTLLEHWDSKQKSL